jgi:hypothetical protein
LFLNNFMIQAWCLYRVHMAHEGQAQGYAGGIQPEEEEEMDNSEKRER